MTEDQFRQLMIERFDRVDRRLGSIEDRLGRGEARLGRVGTRLEAQIAGVASDVRALRRDLAGVIDARFPALRTGEDR